MRTSCRDVAAKLTLLVILGSLSGCVNDVVTEPEDQKGKEPGYSEVPTVSYTRPDNFVGVELAVPTSKCFSDGAGTRATDEDRRKEGWLTNLYLVVIDQDAVTKKGEVDEDETMGYNVIELNTSGIDPQVNDGETLFYINLYPGKRYRFYLIANFDRYLSRFASVSDARNEAELKNTILNFTASRQLEPAHLPMVCLPENFKGKVGNSNEETGIITIPDKEAGSDTSLQIHLYADLQFLCAKVRYTILYNNQVGGCSQMFGNNSIRFVVNQNNAYPTAENVRQKTRLFLDKLADKDAYLNNLYITDESGNKAAWNLTLSRYQFPTKNDNPNENYPESANDMLVAWPNDRNLNAWKESRQRAWQGVVYLPENNPVAEIGLTQEEKAPDRTMLRFPFVMEKYVGEDGTYQDANFSQADGVKEIYLFDQQTQTHYPGNNEYESPEYGDQTRPGDHWLQRGYFYDVVAKVVNPNPDDLEMFIQVYVSDQPWMYHENSQVW